MKLRTSVYVDGYNLYYGRLKNSSYKWLDLKALTDKVLSGIYLGEKGDVEFELQPVAIKYFTAPILVNFAKSNDSVPDQEQYHQALEAHLNGVIEIIKGEYVASPARAHLYQKGTPARACEKVDIWKLVEKQSDVALALHAYSDAIRGEIDHAVIITNDTDIVPALKLIKAHTSVKIGIISTTRTKGMAVNQDLDDHSDWTRKHISDDDLVASQLPNLIRIANSTKVIHKPISWYPRPEEFIPLFEEVQRVRKTKSSALKWLNEPCERLGGRVPLQMIGNDADLLELKAYMAEYAKMHP